MKKEQLLKILKVAIISTIIILIAEAIFDIPAVSNWFSSLITNSSGVVVWIVIWIIMFLQVTILNIPAYVILSACVNIGIETLSFKYILIVLSAYMCGCLLSYFLGYKFGKKAVKWCAGSDEDYKKWSNYLNKKGKIWYFLTVLFPFFPDDLLCIIAGAVKFDFGFYTIANVIGRGVGLTTMLLFLKFVGNIGGGFPIMLVVWAVALVAEVVGYYIIKSKKSKIKPEINDESSTSQTKNESSAEENDVTLNSNDEQKNIDNQAKNNDVETNQNNTSQTAKKRNIKK